MAKKDQIVGAAVTIMLKTRSELGPLASSERYSAGAVALHWIIALALAFEIAVGFTLAQDTSGFALYRLHKSVGIAILALTLARIGWRLSHRPPPSLQSGLAHSAAKIVHVSLYAFMLAAPLSGWAMVSTDSIDIPTVLFGVVPWPDLPLPAAVNGPTEEAHEVLGWIGMSLFALHVLGAARHELLLRHALMRRISPGGYAPFGTMLSAAVILLGLLTLALMRNEPPERPAKGNAPAVLRDQVSPGDKIEAASEERPADDAVFGAERAAKEQAAKDEDQPLAPPKWTIVGARSLTFSVGNGGDTIKGRFSDWSGDIAFDPERPETADIRIDINLASASVADATQDEMLSGAEFFDIANFRKAKFAASSAHKIGPDSYQAEGTLFLKGLKQPQRISFRLSGRGPIRHVTGNARVSRGQFGIGGGASDEALERVVNLQFAFDATKQ